MWFIQHNSTRSVSKVFLLSVCSTTKMSLSKPESFEYLWKTIHALAAKATTPEKRKEYKHFVEVTLPMLLPCDACAEHWKYNLRSKYLIEHYMGSAEQLLLWSVLLHTIVSNMLGKPPEHTPSYHEIKKLYLPEPGEVVCHTVCQLDEHGNPPPMKTKKKTSTSRRQPMFKYRN